MNIPAKEKIRGIVYAYTPEKRYDLVRELGVDWIRLNIPFPWVDKIGGEVSERWTRVKDEFREAVDAGLHVMPSTPTIFGFNEEICGKRGSDEFYENVRLAARFMCEDLGELAKPKDAIALWQCMNELDIPTFSGDVPIEICVETCRQTARGILDVNPDAKCGTNFASWRDESRRIGEMLFAGEHPFAYVGDDQYFGSWQPGTVEDWNSVLDGMWEAFHLPILINEWGFSSRGNPGELDLKTEGEGHVCFAAWANTLEGGHSEAVQAEYFRRGLEIFAAHPHVLGNFMFCFSDAKSCWQCNQDGCPAECYWGLCDVDCNPKPAYFAAKETIRKLYF